MAINVYDNASIMAAILNETPSVASRYPEITKENVKEVGYNIAYNSDVNIKNAVYQTMLNMISAIYVKGNRINNPLAHFIKGGIYHKFGDIIENIKVHVAKSVSPKFLADNIGTGKTIDPFVQKLAEVETEFFQSNLPLQYLVTIQDFEFAKAFDSETGLSSLIAAMLESIDNGLAVDLYQAGKDVINAYINSTEHTLAEGQVVVVDDVTNEATGKEFVLAVKNILSAEQFPTTAFNPRHIMQTATGERLTMYCKPELINKLGVDVWASAFNRDDLDLTPVDGTGKIRIKSIDNFGGVEPKGANNEALQEVYDVLGSVVGYIDAAATVNGPAHKNANGQWVVNITSAGTTADTTFPTEPDHFDDPNADVLAVIATDDTFGIALKYQQFMAVPNPRGAYVNYWYNHDYWVYYSDLENVVIIKKHTT